MNEELITRLYETYPELFQLDTDCNVKTDGGVRTCNGWYSLINQLSRHLQRYIDTHNTDQVKYECIKEKFGCLSIYASGGDDVTEALINMACGMSEKICELCGSMHDDIQTCRIVMRVQTLCNRCKQRIIYNEDV